MSFKTINGMKLVSTDSEMSYIISDCFAVCSSSEEIPIIYEWKQLLSVNIFEKSVFIKTKNTSYNIKASYFENRKQFLRACAVIEAEAGNAGVLSSKGNKLIPTKNLYSSGDLTGHVISARGEYNIKEVKNSALLLLIGRISRILWCSGIIGGVISLLLFNTFIGFKETNWWYLIIGSFFIGVGCVAVIYILMMIVSKFKYANMLSDYIKYKDELVFVVNKSGFGVIESDTYTQNDIILWDGRDSYMETNTMFIIIRNNKPLAWFARSMFTLQQQSEISKLMALNLEQK